MIMVLFWNTLSTLTKRKANEANYFYHWQARSRLSSASYALPRKKHRADLICQASITVVSKHLTTRKEEEGVEGRSIITHWSHELQRPYQNKYHCHHPDQGHFHAHPLLHPQASTNTDATLSTPPNTKKQNCEVEVVAEAQSSH